MTACHRIAKIFVDKEVGLAESGLALGSFAWMTTGIVSAHSLNTNNGT